LTTRARAQPKNSITRQQLELLLDSLSKLRQLHELGLSTTDIELSSEAFETQTASILLFEISKKRGEK
jgi:hypothetical protein